MLQVPEVTVYAFSIENFNRPKQEVDTLLGLLRDKIQRMQSYEKSYVRRYKVRVKIIGNKSMIPADILADLEDVEARTNLPDSKHTLNICFPYTSRDDMTHAIKMVSNEIQSHSISKDEVCEQSLTDNMYFGANSLPLELLIRTSGHNRLSDFMLWQCTTNCKVVFIEELWPDFKFLSLYAILLQWSFQKHTEENGKRKKIHPDGFVHVDLRALPKAPPFALAGK